VGAASVVFIRLFFLNSVILIVLLKHYRPLGVLVRLLPRHASVAHPHLAAAVVASIKLVDHFGVRVAELTHGSRHVCSSVGLPQDSFTLVLEVVRLRWVVLIIRVPCFVLLLFLHIVGLLHIVITHVGRRLEVRHLPKTGTHLRVRVLVAGTAFISVSLAQCFITRL
jgi:hypothetical protein